MHKLTKAFLPLLFLIIYTSLYSQNTPCTDKTDVVVTINLDNFPAETDFKINPDPTVYPTLTCISYTIDWASLPADTTITRTFNLLNGCHDFIISDTAGNGLCCENGNGSYTVSIDGNIIISGGNFGAADTTSFCTVAPTCTDGIQNGNEEGIDCGDCCVPCPTCNDGIQNGDETAIDCGGSNCLECPPPPCTDKTDVVVTINLDNFPAETDFKINPDPTVYPTLTCISYSIDWANLPADTTITRTFNLLNGCHDFIISDTAGNGLCCENGNGSYTVSIDGNVIISGGNFGAADTTSFCTVAPTCADGIQNGNEEGIDCGDCCVPCSTCDDGILNGDETAIDCGGTSCDPCPPCPEATEAIISLTFDNYPGEIAWEILDENANLIASGNGYGEEAPLSTLEIAQCIGSGCHTFNITDSYGDGMCCQYGNGSYSITVDDIVIVSGGDFGFSESRDLCLTTCFDGIQNGSEAGVDCGGTSCEPCAAPCLDNELRVEFIFDDYPEDISWLITDSANGNTIANGGSYAQPAGVNVVELECLPDGCFEFVINDAYGDGLCCQYGNGSYTLVYNGQVLSTGSEFTDTESYSFCLFGGEASNCSDGVQNGDETGVDCGGSCNPCCGTELTFDDFETGFGNWNDGGNDCFRSSNQNNAASGTYSIRLRDNSGAASSMFSNSLDVSGINQLRVDFTYKGVGMEIGEDFGLQTSINGGASWQTEQIWTRGVDFENQAFISQQVYIDVSEDASTILRFICDASANNDKIFIDDVGIYSCDTQAMKGGVDLPHAIVIEERNSITIIPSKKVNLQSDQQHSVEIKSNIYPNPTKEVVNLAYTLYDQNEVRVYITNISGKRMLELPQGMQGAGEYKLPFNIEGYSPGIYIMTLQTDAETVNQKFIVIQ